MTNLFNTTFKDEITSFRKFELEFYEQVPGEMLIYQRSLLVIGVISVLLNFLAVYVILNHSPSQIGTYKLYLLNIVFWSASTDLYLTFLYVPYNPHPQPGVCSCGILKLVSNKHVQVLFSSIWSWMSGAVGSSIVCAFIYRYYSLCGKAYLMEKPISLILIVLLHFSGSIPAIYNYVIITSNQEEALKIANEYVPLVLKFLAANSCFIYVEAVIPDTTFITPLLIFLLLSFNSLLIIVFIYKILRYIHGIKSSMSRNVLRTHTNLTISLVVQAAIPCLSILIPVVCGTFMPAFVPRYSMKLARYTAMLTVQSQSCHSILNSLTMIVIIKPYRKVVLNFKLFAWLKPKNRVVNATESSIGGNVANVHTAMVYQLHRLSAPSIVPRNLVD